MAVSVAFRANNSHPAGPPAVLTVLGGPAELTAAAADSFRCDIWMSGRQGGAELSFVSAPLLPTAPTIVVPAWATPAATGAAPSAAAPADASPTAAAPTAAAATIPSAAVPADVSPTAAGPSAATAPTRAAPSTASAGRSIRRGALIALGLAALGGSWILFGGTVAAAVWDYGDGMQMLRMFWDEAVALNPATAAKDERQMKFCRPGELGAFWRARGFEQVVEEGLSIETRFAGFGDYWEPFLQGQGPDVGRVAQLLVRVVCGRAVGILDGDVVGEA